MEITSVVSTYPNRVRVIRQEEAMLTIGQLSKVAEVSDSTIGEIERGTRRGSRLIQAKIARGLGKEIWQVFPHDCGAYHEPERPCEEVA